MLEKALRYLLNAGAEVPQVHVVDEDDDRRLVIVNTRHEAKVESFPRMPNGFAHRFYSLEGFLDFLDGEDCEGAKGIVFVGPDVVHADLYYGSKVGRSATLEMKLAEEFVALKRILFRLPVEGERNGWNTSKDLWRLLISDLDGCFDPALELSVANLELSADSVSSVSIGDLGEVDESQSSKITLVSSGAGADGGSVKKTINKEWTWTGRIMESFDTKFEIGLRLEVDTKGCLFTFHPRGLEAVLRGYRSALVEHIDKSVMEKGRFTVYEAAV